MECHGIHFSYRQLREAEALYKEAIEMNEAACVSACLNYAKLLTQPGT